MNRRRQFLQQDNIRLLLPDYLTQCGNGARVGRRREKGTGRVRVEASQVLAPASDADYPYSVNDLFRRLVARLNRDDNGSVAEAPEFLGQCGNIAFYPPDDRMIEVSQLHDAHYGDPLVSDVLGGDIPGPHG